MIDFTKPVTTRDGHPVVILGTDFVSSAGGYPVVGYLVPPDGEQKQLQRWNIEGKFVCGYGNGDLDLVNAPERCKTEGYISFYRDAEGTIQPYSYLHPSLKEARKYVARDGGIAIAKVSIDIPEGEGL